MTINTDPVLLLTKSQLNIDASCTAFDAQIITLINSAFMRLKRLGVGPKEGFTITPTGNESWSDFMADGSSLEAIKTYVYLKVKMVFDPPASSTMAAAFNEEIKELEWSLHFEEDCMANNEGG